MAVCTYFGQDDCTAPVFGGSTATGSGSAPSPHVNFFHHLFGTSTVDIVLNLVVLAGLLYVAYVYVWHPLLGLIARFRRWHQLTRVPAVWLEVTPPSQVDKSPHAVKQLFATLQDIINRGDVLSLELAASHDAGTRYIMRIKTTDAMVLQGHLTAHISNLRFKELPGSYRPEAAGTAPYRRVLELRQARHYAYPLQEHNDYAEHDLAAYMVGAMSKLTVGETVTAQLVISPHHSYWTDRLRNNLQQEGFVLLDNRVKTFIVRHWLVWVVGGLFGLVTSDLRAGLAIMAVGLGISTVKRHKEVVLRPAQQRLFDGVQAKLDQPLFQADTRVLVVATTAERLRSLTKGVRTSLASLNVPGYQALRVKQHRLALPWQEQFTDYKLTHRLPSLLPSSINILAASELASLYHFPYGDSLKIEGLVKSRSQELPAPLSIKRSDAKLDVIVGVNQHGGDSQPIGVTLGQRRMHAYVIGKTGTGKSTLLTSSIYQDMMSGKGLAMLDAHGDMYKELLRVIPEHRKDDVVIFNPNDEDYPFGLNILDPGIAFSSENRRQKWITDHVMSIFEKLTEEKYWGPRMEHVLRSTTLTALQVPNCSLYTIQRLLTDKSYQRKIAKTLTDPVLKQFWQKEFALMGSMQLSKVAQPLTTRLGNFITLPSSRHILLQEKSTISIADIMNEGKILLVNLSKGEIGEDESSFFGTIITSLIWLAAFQRINIPEQERKDFFLYVDEFQNFATERFAEIFSEGRKFRINLITSHQNIAQIKDKAILQVMAENANTLISLKAGPDDEAFILPFMRPEVERGDIVNLAPYHFYMKTTADEAEAAFSGTTVPLNVKGSEETARAAIAYSREHYATPLKDVEAYMEKLFGPDDKPPKSDDKPNGKQSPKKPHGL